MRLISIAINVCSTENCIVTQKEVGLNRNICRKDGFKREKLRIYHRLQQYKKINIWWKAV
jgi:hypothetical protein